MIPDKKVEKLRAEVLKALRTRPDEKNPEKLILVREAGLYNMIEALEHVIESKNPHMDREELIEMCDFLKDLVKEGHERIENESG